MHGPISDGKFSVENLPETPRMMGDADVALIDQILTKLPSHPRLIEFGPWLGGVSQRLAACGELHVVDRFEWSELNAKNFPDVLPEGASFRSIFETRLSENDLEAHVHVSEIDAFEWSGEPLDFCLIDAPRTATELLICLNSIGAALSSSSYVLIKHGLNPAHLEMVALIDLLIAKGFFELVDTGQPKWCNIAALRFVGEESVWPLSEEAGALLLDPLNLEKLGMDTNREALVLRLGRFAQFAALGQFDQALSKLRHHPVSSQALAVWDAIEAQIVVPRDLEGGFAAVAELVSFHHSARDKALWGSADENTIWSLRHNWVAHLENEGKAISIETMLANEQGK